MEQGRRCQRFSGRTSRARAWGLLVVSLAVIVGILSQIWVPPAAWGLSFAAAACAAGGRGRKSARILLVSGACAVALGGARAELARGELAPVPGQGQLQRLVVVVRSVAEGVWPSGSRWVNLVVEVRSGPPGGLAAGARMQVSFSRAEQDWAAGDRLELVARPATASGLCNAGADDRARRVRLRGILAQARIKDDRAVLRLSSAPSLRARARGAIGLAIDRAAPGRSGAVLRALVLGDRHALDLQQRQDWAAAGVAHLLVVSGLHLAAVFWAVRETTRFLLYLILPVSRTATIRLVSQAVTLLVAFSYMAIVGFSISVLRAAIVALLVQSQELVAGVGRPAHFLAATAGGFLLVDPDYAMDPGFQLTFVATAALMLGAARTAAPDASGRNRLWGAAALGKFGDALRCSLIVVLATAPILLHHFGQFSVAGILTNVLVGPVLGPGVLSLALPGALLALLWLDGAIWLLGAAGAVVDIAEPFVLWMGRSGWGVMEAGREARLLWAVAVSGVCFWSWKSRLFGLCGLMAALLLAVLVGDLGSRPNQDALRVRFLDVGQGDAILLAGPGETHATLVDLPGRLAPPSMLSSVVLPVLRRSGLIGIQRIIASHEDWDHAGGLQEVRAAYPDAEFLLSPRNTHAGELRGIAGRKCPESGWLQAGDRLVLGGARAEVLQPGARSLGGRNDNSLVLAVQFGATSLLLTGDIETAGEQNLVRHSRVAGSSILKVPHHGSRTSSQPALLDKVRPAAAVVQAGRRNRFGFPHAEVVARYRSRGAVWLNTAAEGEIRMVSDGQIARLRTCRRSES